MGIAEDLHGFVQVLIPHRTDVKIESMVASQGYLVVFQRIQGLQVRGITSTADCCCGVHVAGSASSGTWVPAVVMPF